MFVDHALQLHAEVSDVVVREGHAVVQRGSHRGQLGGEIGDLRPHVLGVGIGRNWMEYEALNEDFTNRGKRIEEQIEILRRYWTEELVTVDGEWHQLDRVGLNPMPVQQPIPIWMGSFFGIVVEKVLERIGRMADGWMPQFPPDKLAPILERVRGYASDAGRDPSSLGIECGIRANPADDPQQWVDQAIAYAELGATHLKCLSVGDGLERTQDRIDLLTRWYEAVAPATRSNF